MEMPEALGIPSLLPAPSTQTALSKVSKRKRKQIELEPEIKVPGLDCDMSIPEGITFMDNVVFEVAERGLCFTDEYGNPAFQRWSDIDRAGIKAMLMYLMLASPVRCAKNVRFYRTLELRLRSTLRNTS